MTVEAIHVFKACIFECLQPPAHTGGQRRRRSRIRGGGGDREERRRRRRRTEERGGRRRRSTEEIGGGGQRRNSEQCIHIFFKISDDVLTWLPCPYKFFAFSSVRLKTNMILKLKAFLPKAFWLEVILAQGILAQGILEERKRRRVSCFIIPA